MSTFLLLVLLPLYVSCASPDLVHPSQGKNELTANVSSFIDDKSNELMTDAKNSVKVFFKCLHANRTVEEAVAIAVTTFASSRSTRGIRAEKFTLSRDIRKLLDKEFIIDAITYTLRQCLATSLGVVALGGLAVLPPIIFPKYFRSVDENWLTENRQIHRFLTNSLVGVSE